eukprot:6667588-Ditylum_brightwellii.AAC.1
MQIAREGGDLIAIIDRAELLRWHYRLGHLSFYKLQTLAKQGVIPKRLAHLHHPKCAGCIYGSMTKRAWRTKAKQNRQILAATNPGQCTS